LCPDVPLTCAADHVSERNHDHIRDGPTSRMIDGKRSTDRVVVEDDSGLLLGRGVLHGPVIAIYVAQSRAILRPGRPPDATPLYAAYHGVLPVRRGHAENLPIAVRLPKETDVPPTQPSGAVD